ncbi:hypothetical protein Poli38472_009641 [Pythium oligandrum]|uniref:Uncharacterized protein n=1 Tax=Pythium oligandrum TaxID=41045 RepID=A0A8K1CFN0_PYTOL|nr:hypothetical protein Poli38472_009641 [Pythium oligandrum]|eukprot:TMW62148.1 hypothetical protein Poli38472_009641 [Pythium oligandrum]
MTTLQNITWVDFQDPHDPRMPPLLPGTIRILNTLPSRLTDMNNAALILQISDQYALHEALALPEAPIPQGRDVEASVAAYRAWIIRQADRDREGQGRLIQNDDAICFAPIGFGCSRAVQCAWGNQLWQVKQRVAGMSDFGSVFRLWKKGRKTATIAWLRGGLWV